MNIISTAEKAAALNSDPSIYGTFAEIGAGQETSRWFFRTRGSSNTLAKTISAYDMSFSDAIYGKEDSNRYVCQDRLQSMIEYEYSLLCERLNKPEKRLFSFANTVAARSKQTGKYGRGWVGLKWQNNKNESASEIHLHVKMKDSRNILQQETLGALGVNLIYAAYFINDPKKIIESLNHGLGNDRIEIDFIQFSGERYSTYDQRILNFHLIEQNMSPAIYIDSSGQCQQAVEQLWGKSVLLFRETYNPITNMHLDLIACAKKELSHLDEKNLITLPEIPFSSFSTEKNLISRLSLLQKLGLPVLLTNTSHLYELKEFCVQSHVNGTYILSDLYNFKQIFDEEKNKHLLGKTMEAIGRLEDDKTKILISPSLKNNKIIELSEIELPKEQKYLINYLNEKNFIITTKCVVKNSLSSHSQLVVEQIKQEKNTWKELTPEACWTLLESNFTN